MYERRTGAGRPGKGLAGRLGGWLVAVLLPGPVLAAAVDFESPLYVHGRTVDQVDGWSRSSSQPGDTASFRAWREDNAVDVAAPANTWLRVATDDVGTLFRDMPATSGALDLQWRWRMAATGAHLCLGVSGSGDQARPASRALACFAPQGGIKAFDLLKGALTPAGGIAWEPGRTYWMRMRLDAATDEYSVFLATDSLRGGEKLVAGPLRMTGGPGTPLTRVVVRPEGGLGLADVDDIRWTDVTVLPQEDVVAEPEILPEPIDFSDSLVVTMRPVTEGSVIHYTLDGSEPTTQKPVYARPLVLRATTVVKAMAVKSGMANSPVHVHAYTRITLPPLGRPTAEPPGATFTDSVVVKLNPPAGAPTAAVWYRVDAGSLLRYEAPFTLKASATVRAFAIQGPVQGDTSRWTFLRRLEAPALAPRGRKFADTLRVFLSGKDTGATLRYTLDGREPDSASPAYAGGGLLLDATATVRAMAFRAGSAPSLVQGETYELVPDSLFASHAGGDYSSPITVTLRVTSARASIWYSLDGTEPGPGKTGSRAYSGGIPLDTTTHLRAVAVAGEGAAFRRGRELSATYAFIDGGVLTVEPGKRVEISPRYSLVSPSAGAQPVRVTVIRPEGLGALKGFRDVQFGLEVTLPAQSASFPALQLGSPAGEERALYSLSPSGVVRFVSDADTALLPGTGTYFLGVDTLPPAITLSGETFHGDSTRVLFTIQDNVSSLTLELDRSDAPAAKPAATAIAIANPEILTLTLKAPEGTFAPLWVRLRVDDRRNTARFPAEATAEYHLMQKTSKPARSPAVLAIGSSGARPWDLVSIPLELSGRLTLGRVREQNPGRALEARMLHPATGTYMRLFDSDVLEPGKSYWLGSDAALSSLQLPALQTAGRQGRQAWQVRLKPGWNQVANPSLRPLLWPHVRSAPGYAEHPVKALHGYDPSLPGDGYFESDTLHPWKGYFALHKGTRDTTVTLLTAPAPAPAAVPPSAKTGGKGAGTAHRMAFALRLGRLPALHLGALPRAADGLGMEDEPQPPGIAPGAARGPGLWAARLRHRLGTDIAAFVPGAVAAWRVVASGNVEDTSSARGARVEGLDLPEGYAAWAVSRARGLRFALREGARIPLPAGEPDSLDVYAGPAAALEARLAGIPLVVAAFRADARARPGAYRLDLALPHAASVRWSLWTPEGRRLDAGERLLPPGHYSLERPVAAAAGARLLRVEWAGGGGRGSLVRKLVLP